MNGSLARHWLMSVGGTGYRAQVIFGVHEGRAVLLHGFVKKTQETPERDLDLARRHLQEVTS